MRYIYFLVVATTNYSSYCDGGIALTEGVLEIK